MPRKSLFAQVDAVAIPGHLLKPSPRHWNCGLFKYRGSLWMAYRYHLDTPDSRCGIAICEINPKTLLPKNKGQYLDLGPKGNSDLHHEDPRLFTFKGEPYISYTEMSEYRPGVDYSCIMKYARLSLRGGVWRVVSTYLPRFGNNDGRHKEKNWVFFEQAKKLYCIYSDTGSRMVLQIDGEKVVETYQSEEPYWDWGDVRGGTPPIDLGDGTMLTIFHSSAPIEEDEPRHYVRYYGAAYTFESKPPFKVLQISKQPIMCGSEEDGHKVDPRYTEGWKPFVVFPCGMVKDKDTLLVSLGVNDWQCAIAKIPLSSLELGSPREIEVKPRWFMSTNSTLPVRAFAKDGTRIPAQEWEVFSAGTAYKPSVGYMKVVSSRMIHELTETPGVVEISEQQYEAAKNVPNKSRTTFSTY